MAFPLHLATAHPGAQLYDLAGRIVATPTPRAQFVVRPVTHAGRQWYQIQGTLHTGLLVRQHDAGWSVAPTR